MRLRIGERERRSPRPAENLPADDAEMFAQALYILHQIPGGVLFEGSVRNRAAAAALIEQHDAVEPWIVIAAHDWRHAAAGAAMKHDHRLARGRSALFVIELVEIRDLEASRAVRHQLGIKRQP